MVIMKIMKLPYFFTTSEMSMFRKQSNVNVVCVKFLHEVVNYFVGKLKEKR